MGLQFTFHCEPLFCKMTNKWVQWKQVKKTSDKTALSIQLMVFIWNFKHPSSEWWHYVGPWLPCPPWCSQTRRRGYFLLRRGGYFSGCSYSSLSMHPTQKSIYWGWGLRCSVICQVLHLNVCATFKRKHSIYASSPAVLGDNHSCHTRTPAFIICEWWLCEYLWAYFTSWHYLSQAQWAELGAYITKRTTA